MPASLSEYVSALMDPTAVVNMDSMAVLTAVRLVRALVVAPGACRDCIVRAVVAAIASGLPRWQASSLDQFAERLDVLLINMAVSGHPLVASLVEEVREQALLRWNAAPIPAGPGYIG